MLSKDQVYPFLETLDKSLAFYEMVRKTQEKFHIDQQSAANWVASWLNGD